MDAHRAQQDEWIFALESVEIASRERAGGRPRRRGWGILLSRLLRAAHRRALTLCDALLLSLTHRPSPTARADLHTVVDPRSRHFLRPAAALRLLDTAVPGIATRFGSFTLREARLPVVADTLTVLDWGSGDTVYALSSPRGRFACKIQRASLGRSLPELVALASHRRRGYEMVLRHYADVREVFPPTQFLVVHGPVFGAPAVLSLQSFVDGRRCDVLRDLDDRELLTLLVAYPRLRTQLVRFIRRTIEAWESEEWIVDLGPDNLLLVDTSSGLRLVYLDVQMRQVARVKQPSQAPLYHAAIERMRRVLRLAEMAAEPRLRQLEGWTASRVGTTRSTRNDGSR